MASFFLFVVYTITEEGDFINFKCDFCDKPLSKRNKRVYQYVFCDTCFNALTDMDFKELEYRMFEENSPTKDR